MEALSADISCFDLYNNVIDRDPAQHLHAALHNNLRKPSSTFYYLHQ